MLNDVTQMDSCGFSELYMRGKDLGKGHYGTTYFCTELTTGHNYACKCISKHNPTYMTEIHILRFMGLQKHPNIISIKDVLQDDDNVYIMMELCEGGTIFQRGLELRAPFPEPRAAKMMAQIVSAIQKCHSFGIVHRDIKLKNIMFKTKDADSILKVIDFGLSQYFEEGEALTDVAGTPAYVAPEVMEGRHGPKVDIWSAGVVLYKVLSGFSPFYAKTLEETYKVIMKGDGPCFDAHPWPSISSGAKDLIQRMLKYNVHERFSALEVLEHPWILRHQLDRLE